MRRYVRDAGPLLAELNVLTRCDCTTRNERKAARLAKRMDELEARIDELAAQEELAAIRPELDGRAVMEHLGVAPGPVVGEALAHLLEIRLDEGEIGHAEALKRLDAWWRDRADPIAHHPRVSAHRRAFQPGRVPQTLGGQGNARAGATAAPSVQSCALTSPMARASGVAPRRGAGSLSVVVAGALLVGLVVLVIRLDTDRSARARRGGHRRRTAGRRRGGHHLARVAAHHGPPQPHDRPADRGRVRAARPARRPSGSGDVGRRPRDRARRQRPRRRARRPARRGPRRAPTRRVRRVVAPRRADVVAGRWAARRSGPADVPARAARRRPDGDAGRGARRSAPPQRRRGDRAAARHHRARGARSGPGAGPPAVPAGLPLGADRHGPRAHARLDDHRRQPFAGRDARPPDRPAGRPIDPRLHPPRRPARRRGPRRPARARQQRQLPARPTLPAQRRRVRVGAHPCRADRGQRRGAGDHPHRGRDRAATHRRAAAVGGHPRRPDRPPQPHRAAGPRRRLAGRRGRR